MLKRIPFQKRRARYCHNSKSFHSRIAQTAVPVYHVNDPPASLPVSPFPRIPPRGSSCHDLAGSSIAALIFHPLLSSRYHSTIKSSSVSISNKKLVNIFYKVHLLGKIVGRDAPGAPCPPLPQLSAIGQYVQRLILNIETSYPFIKLLNHVVMPNHIHLLLEICSSESGAPGASRPTQTMFEKPCCVPRSTTVIPRVITTLKKFSNADDEYY